MWTRESVKIYAKEFLRKHYWKAFLVCLIVALFGNNHSSSSNRVSNRRNYYPNVTIEEEYNKVPIEYNNPVFNYTLKKMGKSPVFFIAKSTIAILIILSLILWITVGYALEVGQARFFLRGFKDEVSIGNLFSTFNTREYFNIIKVIFVRNLYTILWSILLIIPGIIKYYEYRMVPYIMAEESYLEPNEAIQRSRDMTYGHKSDMFVLELSFIGWYILGLFMFGIGGIFVYPYQEASFAKVYNEISGNDSNTDLY